MKLLTVPLSGAALAMAGCSLVGHAVGDTAKVGGFVVKKTAQATVKTGEVVGHEMHRAVDHPSSPAPDQ